VPKRNKLILFILISFLIKFPVNAIETKTIAVYHFQAENNEIADTLRDVLIRELGINYGAYSVYSVNTDNWRNDFPVARLPANICPKPSPENDFPYAITGEVFDDPDFPASYRLKLYLWNMKENQLLIHDELTARRQEPCEVQMKYLLAWMLSWIEKEEPNKAPAVIAAAPEAEPAKVGNVEKPAENVQQTQAAPEESKLNDDAKKTPVREETTPANDTVKSADMGQLSEKWLYIGLRAGAGSSRWYYYNGSGALNPNNNDLSSLWNANMAMQFSLHVLSCLDIQTEANFSADFGSIKDFTSEAIADNDIFASWTLTVPLLLKLSIRDNHKMAGIFGGVYFYLPMFKTNSAKLDDYLDYKPDLLGYTFGINLGWKLGPGFLFADGRMEFDGQWFSSERGPFHYRNMVKLNIGYELGFINK